jgi:hypothetical protein
VSVAAVHKWHKFGFAIGNSGRSARGNTNSGVDAPGYALGSRARGSTNVNRVESFAGRIADEEQVMRLIDNLPKRAEVAELVDAHV